MDASPARNGRSDSSVLDDDYPVGLWLYMMHIVIDEYNGKPVITCLLDGAEYPLRLTDGESCSGLIQE